MQGDSGGPLICSDENGSKFLAGLTSWGLTCGHPSYPGVYSHIIKYRSWIEESIGVFSDSIRSETKRKEVSLKIMFFIQLFIIKEFIFPLM